MSRITIPIDALTSRINLGDRFSGIRSQSLGQRFSNLKPISEFLDLKRLSKPRDFADVQARVNYNLAYFSSNYAVIFVMLSIYSLLTNWWLLFDIILVTGGMWSIGKLGGNELVIGTFRATTSQLYTGLVCVAVPIAFIASPIYAVLWLVGASCGRPRTPYDAPHWGRPPGARLRRGSRDTWGRYQSWEVDPRFEELEDSDAGDFAGVEFGHGYAQDRFHSEEPRFDGIDYGSRATGRRRLENYYHDNDYVYSEGEEEGSQAITYRLDRQTAMREKEEELLRRALERIARARALGKTNVKLSRAEIDALERMEQSQGPRRQPAPAPKSAPKSKKTSPDKNRIAETRKSKTSTKSSSPKPKPSSSSRTRGRSTASNQSARDIDYQLPPADADYGYPRLPPSQLGYMSHPASRTASSQSLRQMRAPPYSHPYDPHDYSARYYEDYNTGSAPRPSSKPSRMSITRPDPSEPDWEPKARSNSSLVNYPLDQLPNHNQTSRAPRFDPQDPRFGSPQRRVVSGPPGSTSQGYQYRSRAATEEDLEVMSYRVSSSDEDDDSGDDSGGGHGVQIEMPHSNRRASNHASGGGGGAGPSFTTRMTRGAAAASKGSGTVRSTGTGAGAGKGTRKR